MYSPLAMQQFEVDKMFKMVSHAQNTVKTIIVLPFKNKYFNMYAFNVLNEMYSCDSKAESHDPSEIILICWFDAKTFIIISVENFCAS